MSYLIDTNGWIGFFEGQRDFGPSARRVMESGATCCISIASIWEAAIKLRIGKLKLPYDLGGDLPHMIEDNGFGVLEISVSDAVDVKDLERHHDDPFDRIMAVQALRRGWQIISRDPVFETYGLRRVW